MAAQAQSKSKVVAVMQPYFAAYAGYYRLLAASDVFVIFDCVQFIRRGWVHRNQLPGANGDAGWLTLPLKHAAFDAPIRDLEFAPDAEMRMAERMRAFPSLQRLNDQAVGFLRPCAFRGDLVGYLEDQLRTACDLFGFTTRLIRSSSLAVPPEFKGQHRVLEIARRVCATDYVNAPSGVGLYDPDLFRAQGVSLHFLEPFVGPYWSLLHRLAVDPEACRADILAQTPDLHGGLKRTGSLKPAA